MTNVTDDTAPDPANDLVNDLANDLAARCDVLEECYEFMLAYAAQGLNGEACGQASRLREFLASASTAAAGLQDAYAALIPALVAHGGGDGDEARARHEAFLPVLGRDAERALAALDLARVQPRLSSQLIDNLNASLHLRTLLTDLFLIDEIVRIVLPRPDCAPDAAALAEAD
ncbi:hypothetical protein dsx2_3130 [Desulfovibrio sp. X2]|uniref:hypothetical protein n=1 Tax=Desulfovibrio sp. X2 TaxID=941449 RepID=UPI000358E9B3|nr:hypothetical protein [Desulfovibrio sp. X2]EPR41611.1 hypothetical protein dsx2_3130 [Desulfovibrio sp. X2]